MQVKVKGYAIFKKNASFPKGFLSDIITYGEYGNLDDTTEGAFLSAQDRLKSEILFDDRTAQTSEIKEVEIIVNVDEPEKEGQ
jgi:hypothetical protein